MEDSWRVPRLGPQKVMNPSKMSLCRRGGWKLGWWGCLRAAREGATIVPALRPYEGIVCLLNVLFYCAAISLLTLPRPPHLSPSHRGEFLKPPRPRCKSISPSFCLLGQKQVSGKLFGRLIGDHHHIYITRQSWNRRHLSFQQR